MKLGSIGLRLTLWYAGVMAAALLAFCGGLWLALEHSLYHAIDESLRDRVEGVRQFIDAQAGSLTLEEMQEEFREHSVLGPGGDLFQVADQDGNWLYRSGPLYDEHVPVHRAVELGSAQSFENIVVQGTPLRFLAQNVDVQGRRYTVQVAAPLSELERGLREFLWIGLPAVPLILLAASAGGYWISRRALRPVDKITETARSITAENLSRRLVVPQSGDELERLSLTLNEMIQRLEASFKRISRFTADASHELRTPLAIMRTAAEVALRNPAALSDQLEALQDIVAELERSSELVDNLLLMARADSGDAQLARAPVDVVEAIREACSHGVVLARAKEVAFDLQAPCRSAVVNGDQPALRRLFLLLIDNAVKYTPEGGRVKVSLVEEAGAVVVAVEDTGIGIAEKHQPHIFDRFYRVEESRCRERGGAGLGLAIGRWIAEAHGGTLSVTSLLGRGSVFTVRLPMLGRVEGDGAADH